MKTVRQLIEELYPDYKEKLEEMFPNMYKFARQVEIIPWEETFQKTDKNPEIFQQIEFLQMLLENGMISEEEYRKSLKYIHPGYASITKGISFIKDKKVAFRDKIPPITAILHELGHIYFKEDDYVWNSVYGGGESLLHLTLTQKASFTEKDIKNHMRFMRLILLAPISKLKEIDQQLTKYIRHHMESKNLGSLSVNNSVLSLILAAGTLPGVEFEEGEDLLYEHIYDKRKIDLLIKKGKIVIKSSYYRQMLIQFLLEIIDGYQYQDPFYQNYGNAYFYHLSDIVKTTTKILNPSIQNIEEFEKEFELPFIAHYFTALGINKNEAISKKDNPLEIIEKYIFTPFSNLLPVDRYELIIGSNKLIIIKSEVTERLKDYLNKNPNIQLPQIIKDILEDNNIKV